MGKGEFVDSLCDKSGNRKEDILPVEFLEGFYDQFEMYKLMSDTFFEYIPDELRVKALAHVAEIIQNEKRKK